MDWSAFFKDMELWMQASNEVLKKYPIDSDKYWEWMVHSTGKFGNKYNNHPLVIGFLNTLITFQEDVYKQFMENKKIA